MLAGAVPWEKGCASFIRPGGGAPGRWSWPPRTQEERVRPLATWTRGPDFSVPTPHGMATALLHPRPQEGLGSVGSTRPGKPAPGSLFCH